MAKFTLNKSAEDSNTPPYIITIDSVEYVRTPTGYVSRVSRRVEDFNLMDRTSNPPYYWNEPPKTTSG